MEILTPITISDVGPLVAGLYEHMKRHETDLLALRLQVAALEHPGSKPNLEIVQQVKDHHEAQLRAYEAIISRCRQQKNRSSRFDI
jgi:hypothetical protein